MTPMMKLALLLFAVLAVVIGPARALQCHVCESSSNCKEAQSCPSSARYCRTVVTVETLSGNLVKKDCADHCQPSLSQQGQVSSGSSTTMCCQGNLCNSRSTSKAAPRATRTALALPLALGLLALGLAPCL
ncbi:lymphocyte antigen 6D [Echinops telfairi]|uniref:Lymphocyte antigen 6D n=1 Tax=Echinops telfairi TaxID=9371 RepID=A0ABM0IDP6_ECHTE|nr:lymphocyte antigen 6D [Echinops telfairi]